MAAVKSDEQRGVSTYEAGDYVTVYDAASGEEVSVPKAWKGTPLMLGLVEKQADAAQAPAEQDSPPES